MEKAKWLRKGIRENHSQRSTLQITVILFENGRGDNNNNLIDITRLHEKQVKLLQTYFLNKQVTSSLHAAVVKADDRCTPPDLARANTNELPTDEGYKSV